MTKGAPVQKKAAAGAKAPVEQKPKNNQQPVKEEVKKEEEKKVEEVKVEAPPVVVEEEIKEPEVGDAIIRYNHYKKPFPVVDGVLKWEDIDEEYCFSFVF